MSQEHKHDQVRSRNEYFAPRTPTNIWSETPSDDNPYIAASALCHGYDLFELMEKRSFVDMFYLLFQSELPDKAQAQLLQTLMVGLINPGPRHPATRAAMNAGIGKTDPLHILPIASAVLGGRHEGGGEIEAAMRFFRKHQESDAREFAKNIPHEQLQSDQDANVSDDQERQIAPGFGRHHGGADLMAAGIAARLLTLEGAGKALKWGNEVSRELRPHGIGWLTTGVAAAVFSDLGFQTRTGGCLFQLIGAPGLVAHGLELTKKPITAVPFVSDENYVIER